MSENFKELAAYFSKQPGFQDIGQRAAELAAEVQARGGPETIFEASLSGEQVAEADEHAVEALRISRINTLIHTIYDFQQKFPELRGMSDELAQAINEGLGQALPDEVALQDLLLPKMEDLALESGIDTDQLVAIERLKMQYNGAVGALYRHQGERLRTLGAIRSRAPQDLRASNIGPRRIAFVVRAFAPAPQPEE